MIFISRLSLNISQQSLFATEKTVQSLVDALCESVCKANIRSCESKTESTVCKTFLGLAMFCLKISLLESISRPSVLTQVHPVLVSKADLFFEI